MHLLLAGGQCSSSLHHAFPLPRGCVGPREGQAGSVPGQGNLVQESDAAMGGAGAGGDLVAA